METIGIIPTVTTYSALILHLQKEQICVDRNAE